jgi:hypothetical protein
MARMLLLRRGPQFASLDEAAAVDETFATFVWPCVEVAPTTSSPPAKAS